jgi:regulator of protease activity HflC (stomatin/prohibitin superfamily)
VLEAGRYRLPAHVNLPFYRTPRVELLVVDVRERDLTIKGQEILTADKVAVRVSIVARFRVTDPEAALHRVEDYADRLYTDVQLAARRSLASMVLEEILTNRNQLSDDILRDVQEAASSYGVSIVRADVKDLVFPGNLQEIMNRVLAAQRLSEAQLVEARTNSEVQQIQAEADAAIARRKAEQEAEAERLSAQSRADARRISTEAEVRAVAAQAETAGAFSQHPALLRLRELETLRELSRLATARIYIGFDRHSRPPEDD